MVAVVLATAIAAMLRAGAVDAARVVLPRPGQVGVELQGGYGTLLKSGDLSKDFGNGPTLGVRLRYRMRYERALGLSFENQRFEIRIPEEFDPATIPGQPPLPGRTKINVVLSGLEFYQMFGTRTRTTRMIGIGAGLAQTSGRTLNNETFFPGDGAYINATLAAERFFFRSLAFDLSARYQLLFLPENREHDVQGALGLIFYAGS
jgi:hypothetical protein